MHSDWFTHNQLFQPSRYTILSRCGWRLSHAIALQAKVWQKIYTLVLPASDSVAPSRCHTHHGRITTLRMRAHHRKIAFDGSRRASSRARQFSLTWRDFIGPNFGNHYHRRYLVGDECRLGSQNHPLGVEFVLFSCKRSYAKIIFEKPL